MKIFATSDIHGNKALIHRALEIARKEKVDALIIAGDIAPKGFYQLYKRGAGYVIRSAFPVREELLIKGDTFEIKRRLDRLGFVEQTGNRCGLSELQSKQREKLREICQLLQTADVPIFLLIGNDDRISNSDWDKILEDSGIGNLNSRTHILGAWRITGFQYVLPTPWNTNNELPEEELAVMLRGIERRVNERTIFVTHSPPWNILDRLINGLSAGSMSIRRLLEEKQPVFHIFGHIHEFFGCEKFGNTICCNVSCLWLDRILRGYIIDTDNKTAQKIEEKISIENSLL